MVGVINGTVSNCFENNLKIFKMIEGIQTEILPIA